MGKFDFDSQVDDLRGHVKKLKDVGKAADAWPRVVAGDTCSALRPDQLPLPLP